MARRPSQQRINEILADRSVRHSVYIARLQTHEAREIGKIIQRATSGIATELSRRAGTIRNSDPFTPSKDTKRRLREMNRYLDSELRALKLHENLRTRLVNIATTEAGFQIKMIDDLLPDGITHSFNRPSTALLRSMVTSRPFEGRILRDWSKGLRTTTLDRTMREINVGLTRGESIPTMARRVRSSLNTTNMHAQTVTRTAVNHVSSQAREMTYDDNDDIIKGVQWLSTLDKRTSITCATLDGRTFGMNEGPRPPAHMNCRSTTTPLLKSWKEMGIPAKELPASTRQSMNGEVGDKVKFPGWLRRQPAGVQKEVLGAERYRLFKQGVSIDKMVDSDFRPLSLDQLRRLEGLEVPSR